MKFLISLGAAALMAFGASNLMAQGGNKSLNMGDITAAKVAWKTEKQALGKIPQGKPVTVNFEFTNNGNAPLVVNDVKASCGCTNPQFPKQPIMPGKTATISAVFDAKAVGTFSKTLTVTHSAGTASLMFEGEVLK